VSLSITRLTSVIRIIAGTLGSMRLKTAAKATRPTSDRVKESVFSILESMGALEGARVLDLFAGTGALGLEAVSRGAASAVFVERDKEAERVLRENVATVQNADPARCSITVSRSDAARFLAGSTLIFDLVFFDPPYPFTHSLWHSTEGSLVKSLDFEGKILVASSSRENPITSCSGLSVSVQRIIGDTRVTILAR
jgi:16S rRNA (guanine966-N2)-methyltransferase